jgi:hypothetical protein
MEDGSSGEGQGLSREERDEEREELERDDLEGLADSEDTTEEVDVEKLSLLDKIQAIAAFNARAPLDNEKQILLFLKSWWSRTYNRPLKDPLLETYTVEELLYEFYDHIERVKAAKETSEQESDKIEEDKERAALDWAEAEEKRELEAMKRDAKEAKSNDPTKDPENIAWMEQKLKEAKSFYGEDFGEDIEESFDE